MPFAPSSRRVSRATSVAMLTLFRLASDTCCGVAFPWSLSPELQAEELRLGDLAEHLGEPRLLQLESADRLAEHHPRLGVAHRLVVARHCRAHRSPRDAIARLREAQKRRLEPARLREQGVLGDAHVLQH